ncbi:MAG: hypothetical protein IPM22_14080 [Betaproteobacteria bacterium]|nr:hypothetical protein [Betaproteobacteria bacterium]
MTNLTVTVRVPAIAGTSAQPLSGFVAGLPPPFGVGAGFVHATTKRSRPEQPRPGGPGWAPEPRCSWFQPC